MAEQFLHRANVVARFEQMGGAAYAVWPASPCRKPAPLFSSLAATAFRPNGDDVQHRYVDLPKNCPMEKRIASPILPGHSGTCASKHRANTAPLCLSAHHHQSARGAVAMRVQGRRQRPRQHGHPILRPLQSRIKISPAQIHRLSILIYTSKGVYFIVGRPT